CQVERFGRSTDNGDTSGVKFGGQLKWCLASELNNHPLRLLFFDNCHHIFEGQRFEVKPIRRVVVGRDGLWIAINHDRFEAGVSQSERCMATAVVKFNPLSYSVGSTAQDDD